MAANIQPSIYTPAEQQNIERVTGGWISVNNPPEEFKYVLLKRQISGIERPFIESGCYYAGFSNPGEVEIHPPEWLSRAKSDMGRWNEVAEHFGAEKQTLPPVIGWQPLPEGSE